MSSTTTNNTLNQLIKIHNDRREGYLQAIKIVEPGDRDLMLLYEDMIRQSETLQQELNEVIDVNAEITEDDTTLLGNIYHTWMAVKAKFNTSDRKSTLNSCIYGEEEAQKAYESSLGVLELSSEAQEVIVLQKQQLLISLEKLKRIAAEQI